ncbi:19326_t:CDS:10, partial [Funneliformis geosporum]
MSLETFRKRVLSNSKEERVEVNQRLLIDKILARYAAEFVIFRELMQNSDDAKSTCVKIIFETKFPKQDKSIKDKIGAFGVGFYSLFSVCENPFVTSGGQGMAFFWRGNQLSVKQGPTGEKDKAWTTFLMDGREPMEAFTRNLRDVFVYYNNKPVIRLSKKMGKPRSLKIASHFDPFSPKKMLHLTSVEVKDVQLIVKRLSISKNIIIDDRTEETSIYLRLGSGNLDVDVSSEFSAEMERITKKKPPSKTMVQMLFVGFDEYNSSMDCNIKKIPSTFKDLFPHPEQGRLYIGFPTHQTTGCCSHLAARVIPTVERESIDLVDKTLSVYNHEMLCLTGILCRILYEDEMSQIANIYNEILRKPDDHKKFTVREWFEERAAHALMHFTFKQSTPNEKVGKIIELQFYKCSKNNLSILSTNGVLPITSVRIPNLQMLGFIKKVPIVPQILLKQCHEFFKDAIESTKLIKELTLQDVLYELKNRELSEEEFIELLKWWITYNLEGNLIKLADFSQFMKLATVRIDNRLRALNEFCYVLNPGVIPPDVNLPDKVLPFSISRNLQKQKYFEKWFKWIELPLIIWARFIVKDPDLETNPTFAEKVHQVLGKNLKNTSQNDKEIIRQLFVQKRCVPTKFGMMIPGETYFENVNLFSDLPKIHFDKPSSVQNIMQLLGVRKVVELKLIFDRLVSQGSWDHMQLVKYLVSILNDLKNDEITKLKETPVWSKENSVDSQRFVASDLYVPSELHREFGLPVLNWKGKWSLYTPEGKFLIEMGLRENPTLETILEYLTLPDSDLTIYKKEKALKYFIENFNEKYSKDYNPAKVDFAFLPCSEPNVYAKPLDCFINSQSKIMKFKTIRQDLRFQAEQFGVRQNPSNENLLKSLIEDTPQDKKKAKEIFEYLATQQGSFTYQDWIRLGDLKFIPIQDKICPDTIIHINPNRCFLKVQKDCFGDFFSQIDFGEKANKFLQSCGVKYEPSIIDFAELLVRSSQEIYKSIRNDNVDKYLNVLRKLAIDKDLLYEKRDLILKMKKAPILLSVRKQSSSEIDEIDKYSLNSAKEIFINDNPVYHRVFSPFTVPDEGYLEDFYKTLGSKSLSESVKEIMTPIDIIQYETENSQSVKELVAERAPLFYYNCSKKIKKYEEWLKKLKVKEANQIEINYTLVTSTSIETRKEFSTTCIIQDNLYITSDPDFLDISQQIVKNIFISHDWKDICYINTLLTTPLTSLKRKGYPVDRILRRTNKRIIEVYDENIEPESSNLTVTPKITQELRNSLQDSINSCRSSSEGPLISQPSIKLARESQTVYCDSTPGHSLCFAGTRNEIKLYVPSGVDKSKILSPDATTRFISMLKNIAKIFGLESKVIHVFYDENTSSIAFNRDKSLFFNLNFYIGFHDDDVITFNSTDAMIYWFMTFCHELAHNFVDVHDSSFA